MESTPIEDLVEAIKKCGVFSSLPEQKIFDILPSFTHLTVNKGGVLFSQGDDADYVYVLLQGKLTAFFVSTHGKFKTIGSIEELEPIGEFGALTGEVRSLTIRAETDCKLIGLPCDDFKSLCQDFPTVLLDTVKPIITRSLKTIKLYEDPGLKVEVSAEENVASNILSSEDSLLIESIRATSVFQNRVTC